MEEKKKHIEIIIDMDKDKNAQEVHLIAHKVSARDLVSGYVAAADSVAEAIVRNGGESKSHVISSMALALFALSYQKEEETNA